MTAIVILGAAVWADGPSPTLRRRTAHGAALFHAGRAEVIVPCGGVGIHPPSEAEAMRHLLQEAAVPASAIRTEPQSTTTYENLRNAKVILDRLGMRDVIIVTDGYHGPRAVLVARALGLRGGYDAPHHAGVPIGLRMRRLRHEAFALPAYAAGLPFWIKRDLRNQTWLRNII